MFYRAFARQLVVLLIALLCAACDSEKSFVEKRIYVESRGVAVPATFVYSESRSGANAPLVVMAHGHGGTRDEAGAFTQVADALSENGIASIRMDFSGCGESSEPFTRNFLANMLADIQAAREFAAAHGQIDTERVGILGYSMGGRLAMLATGGGAYSAVALWTPVASNGSESLFDFLGGKEGYERLAAEARESEHAVFTTPWGNEQHLSLKWFTDMAETNPLSVIQEYDGALLVLYGNRDDLIHPRFSRQVIVNAVHSSPRVEYVVDGGGHGLGFYDDLPAMADEVVAATTRFFSENL